jgi:hypothetical protein
MVEKWVETTAFKMARMGMAIAIAVVLTILGAKVLLGGKVDISSGFFLLFAAINGLVDAMRAHFVRRIPPSGHGSR